TNPTQTGEVDLTFVVPGTTQEGTTDFVSFYVIDAESVGATVTAYDPEGVVLFSRQYHQGPGTQERVLIQQTRIARVKVTLGSGADTSAIDNVSFNTPVPANHRPVLDPIADQTTNDTNLLTVTAHATDPDAPPQTLTYSLDAGAPSGAQINPTTGVFTWTPAQFQVPGVYPITVRVTDNGTPVLRASRTFTVTVRDTVPPVVTSFTPTGAVNTPVTTLQVQFNEAILGSTFTAGHVAPLTPGGPLDPATFQVTQLDSRTFRVPLPAQSTDGLYTVTVGPAITDLSSNALAAPYQATFTIDRTGPRVTAVTPTGTVHSAPSF